MSRPQLNTNLNNNLMRVWFETKIALHQPYHHRHSAAFPQCSLTKHYYNTRKDNKDMTETSTQQQLVKEALAVGWTSVTKLSFFFKCYIVYQVIIVFAAPKKLGCILSKVNWCDKSSLARSYNDICDVTQCFWTNLHNTT